MRGKKGCAGEEETRSANEEMERNGRKRIEAESSDYGSSPTTTPLEWEKLWNKKNTLDNHEKAISSQYNQPETRHGTYAS